MLGICVNRSLTTGSSASGICFGLLTELAPEMHHATATAPLTLDRGIVRTAQPVRHEIRQFLDCGPHL
jgi:hypothetical protein